MNMYCLWKSRLIYNHNNNNKSSYNWCFNIKIKRDTKSMTTVGIKQLADKHVAAIESDQSTIDLKNWKYNYIKEQIARRHVRLKASEKEY